MLAVYQLEIDTKFRACTRYLEIVHIGLKGARVSSYDQLEVYCKGFETINSTLSY